MLWWRRRSNKRRSSIERNIRPRGQNRFSVESRTDTYTEKVQRRTKDRGKLSKSHFGNCFKNLVCFMRDYWRTAVWRNARRPRAKFYSPSCGIPSETFFLRCSQRHSRVDINGDNDSCAKRYRRRDTCILKYCLSCMYFFVHDADGISSDNSLPTMVTPIQTRIALLSNLISF